MKKLLCLSFFLLCLGLTACAAQATEAPEAYQSAYAPSADLQATQVPYVTPGLPPVMVGEDLLLGAVAADWPLYTNQVIGYSLNYPPDWKVAIDANDGVHLLPPGSDLDHPSEQIQINYYDVPYQEGVSVFGIQAEFDAGVPGEKQFYLPTGLMIPTQSSFFEMAYGRGVLVFQVSIGPSQNLNPSFAEIYTTLQLLY